MLIKKLQVNDYVESVKSAIEYAIRLGFNVKINSVVIKEFNENIFELAEIAKHNKVSVRLLSLCLWVKVESISIYKAQKLLRDWKKNTENLKKQVTEVWSL